MEKVREGGWVDEGKDEEVKGLQRNERKGEWRKC